jgi:nucleoside-diphosphate kinase
MRTVHLTPQQAQQFYGDRAPSERARELAQGVVLAMEIIGAGVQQALMDAARPASAAATRDQKELGSLLRNVHLAESERAAESELDFLFSNPSIGSTATFVNCTLALIKPHAIQAGLAGSIIDSILSSGFDISALEQFTLDKSSAEEFMEVYKQVVPEYFNMVEQIVSGPVVAMEIRAPPQRLQDEHGNSVSIVSAFRQVVGPSDPEVAKHIRPRSLRAQFGASKVKNAVHCTDLDEDGVLESQFFFDIMQQQQQKMPSSLSNTQTMRR